MQKVTAIVLTHNDEDRIVDCLENLLFSNELIIIDDKSTDRTVDLCMQYTKKIYSRALNGNFASQRNYALNFASNEWVLFVDSDEIVDESLKKEIINILNRPTADGYFLKRVDRMWGRTMHFGEVGDMSLLRLARKSLGKWHGKVHETWKVNGKTSFLKNPLIHMPHINVSEFVREIDEYSTLRANQLFEEGARTNALSIIAYPLAKFIKNYLLKKGYKDLIPGLIYAIMMSFHSFLVRGKLYLLLKKS